MLYYTFVLYQKRSEKTTKMSRYKFGKSVDRSNSDVESKRGLYIHVAVFTCLVFLPFFAYIYFTIKDPQPVMGKTIDKGFYSPFLTFESDWFTFRTNPGWEEVKELTKQDKVYVYRQKVGSNPQGLLSIYVGDNSVPGFESYFSRVLPIKARDDRSLEIAPLQPHCNEVIPKEFKGNALTVTQGETSFSCWVGGTILYAVAGQVGGTSALKLKRADGAVADYIITYRNLAFSPSESSFETVMKTFKSR